MFRTIVPRTEEPASTTSKSSLKNRQRSSTANSALSNNLKQKKEPKSTVPAMISLPTIQRPSRPKEKDSANQLVPHLYAEHRVRSRSGSRENAPPKSLPKDRKKVVAFGRTLTVEASSLNCLSPSLPLGQWSKYSPAEQTEWRECSSQSWNRDFETESDGQRKTAQRRWRSSKITEEHDGHNESGREVGKRQ